MASSPRFSQQTDQDMSRFCQIHQPTYFEAYTKYMDNNACLINDDADLGKGRATEPYTKRKATFHWMYQYVRRVRFRHLSKSLYS